MSQVECPMCAQVQPAGGGACANAACGAPLAQCAEQDTKAAAKVRRLRKRREEAMSSRALDQPPAREGYARRTSAEAYSQIRDSGLLSKRRWEVYSALYHHGPMTSAETFKTMPQTDKMSPLSQTRARFTELRDLGVVQEMGEVTCTVTGHTAILWDVLDGLPQGRVRRQSKLADEVAELRVRVDVLERMLRGQAQQ